MKEIYFTGGKTPPETFPYKELAIASEKALNTLKGVFAYYPTQHEYSDYSLKGYRKLREVASKRYYDREGTELPIDNIVITNGSMQAIELVGRAFINPGNVIIVEELTYYGSLKFFRYLDARIVGIELDDEGMIIDKLEDTLREMDRVGVKAKFIYVIPNNQNPTGVRMPESRRKRLLDLSKEYDIPIIEDDCYGDLDFITDNLPKSILTIDPEKSVIYIGSFSKILAPGVRLGYFYSPDKYLEKILIHRWDIGTSILSSAIVAEYLSENLWKQVKVQIEVIKRKRDAVLKALEENLSNIATWNKPSGGLFIWVKLPEDINMDILIKKAGEKGIYFDPGRAFHYRDKDIKALRLSYAHVPLEDIPYGIGMLSKAIKETLQDNKKPLDY